MVDRESTPAVPIENAHAAAAQDIQLAEPLTVMVNPAGNAEFDPFGSPQRDFERAMVKAETLEQQMDIFLDMTASSMLRGGGPPSQARPAPRMATTLQRQRITAGRPTRPRSRDRAGTP